MGWIEDNRGQGPWDFIPQIDKWGYLNNPRWTAVPVAPVSYSGNEDEEPQIWSPEPDGSAEDSDEHYPCGHWHKVPIAEAPAPVPLDFQVYWELINNSVSQPDLRNNTYLLGSESFIHFNQSEFNGVTNTEFEVIGFNDNTFDITLKVVDIDMNVCATLVLSAGTVGPTGYELFRARVPFTFTSASEYGLRLEIPIGENLYSYPLKCHISCARVIVTQEEATRTKLQIPMLGDFYNYVLQESTPSGRWPYDLPIGRYVFREYGSGLDSFTSDWGGNSAPRSSQYISTIWRYDNSEIASISGLTFSVAAKGWGSEGQNVQVEQVDITSSVPITSFNLLLYKAPVGSPTGDCNSGVPVNYVDEYTVHTDDCTSTVFTPMSDTLYSLDPASHPYSTTIYPDLSGLLDNQPVYIGGEINHDVWGHFDKWFDINIPSGVEPFDATLTIQSLSNSSMRWRMEYYYRLIDGPEDLTVALANKATGAVVSGSELVWEPDEGFSRKEAVLSPTALASGQEYEVVVKCPGQIWYPLSGLAPEIYDAQLWINLNPINLLTVWKRVTHQYVGNSDNFSVPGAWVYTSIGSRIKFEEEASVTSAFFEQTAYLNDSSPASVVMRDMGTGDSSGAGASDVPGSTITFTEQSERERRRSGFIYPSEDDRYCNRQPDAESGDLFANNGFLVTKYN